MSIVLADYLQRKKLVLGMVRRTFHDNSSPSFCNHPAKQKHSRAA